MTHPAALDEERLIHDCAIRFERRSGPGGQNKNKVETAVVLTHRPSGIRAEANEARTQGANRAEAVFRLRLKLAVEIRAPRDPHAGLEPSALWQSRCRGGRVALNPRHPDFPTLLAEALDILEACTWDVSLAAAALSCSATQLVNLLRDEPNALGLLNRQRAARGLRPLR
jgi:hypothetical protein